MHGHTNSTLQLPVWVAIGSQSPDTTSGSSTDRVATAQVHWVGPTSLYTRGVQYFIQILLPKNELIHFQGRNLLFAKFFFILSENRISTKTLPVLSTSQTDQYFC